MAPMAPIAPASVGQPHQDGAEHQKNQHQARHHTQQDALVERPAAQRQLLARQRRHRTRSDDAEHRDKGTEQQHLHDAGADRARVHIAYRFTQLVGEHHQHQRGRD
jgi:hypothetical protein